jgi:hypothetical protein
MKNDTWRVYPTDGGSTKKLVLEMHVNCMVRPSIDICLCKEFIRNYMQIHVRVHISANGEGCGRNIDSFLKN